MKSLRLLLPFVVLFSISCKKKNKTEEDKEPFDKQGLVNNYADNVILPAYLTFEEALDSLTAAYNQYKGNLNISDFQNVKAKYHSAYMKYHAISPFEIGPAETVIIRMNFNVFPTDSVQIAANISSGSYLLDAASNLDAKGFPALDYLFFGNNMQESSVHQLYVNDASRRQYVSDLLSDMSAKVNNVISQWNSGYHNTFVNSLNTDVGSSIGYLVNQINFELDYLKNAKIGIPLGKQTLGIALPEKCEAYYSAQSVLYAQETLKAIEKMYYGDTGLGFDDYLDHLEAEHNGGPLSVAITQQFIVAKNKLNAIANPLSLQVTANPSSVDAAYVELVKLLVLLKTDMPSALGVIITYQDGDGD
jgi:hypothetical protein